MQSVKVKYIMTQTGVTLASRGTFGHPLIFTVTPQCSTRKWPKLSLLAKVTWIYGVKSNNVWTFST